jgi:hypothetical protein
MKFFGDFLCQRHKKSHVVCGDYYVFERNAAGLIYVLCDGIGSGIYANISAITCASRILEMFRGNLSIRMTCEAVAASMHRARKEDIPFAAFSAVVILPDGRFTAYSYEMPNPVSLQNNQASVLEPRLYTAGFEVIGEFAGTLHIGDSLLFFSDGVTQAGLGHGYGMGIGSDGVSDFINRNYKPDDNIIELPQRIAEMCKTLSAGNHEDDTTIALIHCRNAKELTLLTGPPSKQSMDHDYAMDFMNMPGQRVICGSTTASLVARELGLTLETLSVGDAFGLPPEYGIKGIDLVAEGAVTLNQVYNILDEPTEQVAGSSVAERLCRMLHTTDVIHLMVGGAVNAAHEDLIFKQIGIHVRRATIQKIAETLKNMGKLVIEHHY